MSKDIELPSYEGPLLIAQAKLMDEKDKRIAVLEQELELEKEASLRNDGLAFSLNASLKEQVRVRGERMEMLWDWMHDKKIQSEESVAKMCTWFDDNGKVR